MSPQQKNLSIIHNCEEYLLNWLKEKMNEQGIAPSNQGNLSDLLTCHEEALTFLNQHIKPIKKWISTKREYERLSATERPDENSEEQLSTLGEKVAFEGQVLWLTIQEC